MEQSWKRRGIAQPLWKGSSDAGSHLFFPRWLAMPGQLSVSASTETTSCGLLHTSPHLAVGVPLGVVQVPLESGVKALLFWSAEITQYQWTWKCFRWAAKWDVPTNSRVSTDTQSRAETCKALCYTRMESPSQSACGWWYWWHCKLTQKISIFSPTPAVPCGGGFWWVQVFPCKELHSLELKPVRAGCWRKVAGWLRGRGCADWEQERQSLLCNCPSSVTGTPLFLEVLSKNSKLQLGGGDHPNNPGVVKNYF